PRAAPAPAPADPRDLGQDGPRDRAPARPHRGPVREARGADPDAGAEPLPRGAGRGAAAAVARPEEAEPALRRAGADAAAALSHLRQRPEPRHTRLRLLGREPAARPLRAPGRAG